MPALLRAAHFDLGSWPDPDVGALPEVGRWDDLARTAAADLRVAGASGDAIGRSSGIGYKQAVRLIRERCCGTQSDGRNYGIRGLVKRLRINPVQRSQPVRLYQFGRGEAGAVTFLLCTTVGDSVATIRG